ncbi:thiamine phosphate synthase [Candidatus Clostridium radicumherbarum]|uniref:Thiamine-phosphate synthase n=1 Tax=Candidatus Clostridium radicumherbarum TaxID=3381662 RepID=A0ABW8TW03_9CLOT
MEIDYSLYLVTDRSFLGNKSLKDAISEAIEGGVSFIQIREKDISTRAFYNIASEVKEVTDYYKVPLVVNDRIDIAQAIDADGVHLGQSDMPIQVARKILGKNKIIGISVENVKEAKVAEENGADYVGVGTIFYTGTKKDINKPIGLEGLKEVCSSIKIPKVAIGGINKNNLKDILKAGVDGAAIISAILGEKDIKEASKLLKNLF